MEYRRQLAIEAATVCRDLLEELAAESFDSDDAVECALAMCRHIERRAAIWPETRLHRALGFAQGVLVARGVSSYDEQMALVDELKNTFPEGVDEDLEDHHDPDSHFHFELGGSG